MEVFKSMTSSAVCTYTVCFSQYRYTGKERDTESGLDYFGARYYASSTGRFMSPDWADKPDAVPYSKLDNPQSLNLYGYVLNNPLLKIDPDGHCCWDEFKAIFYAKGSVGPGVGTEVKLTKYLSAELSAKLVLETKATSSGVITTALGEVKGGAKAGPLDLSSKFSAEAQVLKNGVLDPKAPELKPTFPSIGGGPVEGTPNEIGVSGHAGVFGGEVGIDVDKVKELGAAVNQSLSDLGGYLKDKVTPPEPNQQNIPSPVPKNPF
jgi:RHS repeat-associated protein